MPSVGSLSADDLKHNKRYQELMAESRKRQQHEETVQVEQKVKHDIEGDCGVPPKYSWVTFREIESRGLPTADPIWTDNWCIVHSYSHFLDKHIENGEGLVMFGARGQLKTSMAAALVRQNYDTGRSSYFVEMVQLVDTLRTMMSVNPKELVDYDRKLRNVSLLVLDDLGSESRGKDWVLDKIESIVSYRYSHNKSTIITSNLTLAEMEMTYTLRILDRLRESAAFVMFEGESFRKDMTVEKVLAKKRYYPPKDKPVEQIDLDLPEGLC